MWRCCSGRSSFRTLRISSGINFGGRQRLAVHRLPGGTRVIDALGRDDAQISFSGIFTGADATLRARSLDELRVAGSTLSLTWDVLFYTVVISDFHADYRNGWWIPYRVVCTVLQDEASTLLAAGDFARHRRTGGHQHGGRLRIRRRRGSVPLQSALAAPGATTRGTAAYTVAQSCLADAQSSIDTSIVAAEATLTGISVADAGTRTSRRGKPACCDRRHWPAELTGLRRCLRSSHGGQSRECQHLTMKTITVVGDNLFRIAAIQLADATQWIRIAELNRLSDPMLAGVDDTADTGRRCRCRRRHCRSVIANSALRAPRLRLIANGQVVAGAMEAEVISNNYYAADRFSATVATGIDSVDRRAVLGQRIGHSARRSVQS